GAEHDLRDPVAIAQVHEQHAAVVAGAVHPAHERRLLRGVAARQLAAGAGAAPVAEALELELGALGHRAAPVVRRGTVLRVGRARHGVAPSTRRAPRRSRSTALKRSRATVSCSPRSRSFTTTSPRFHSSSPSSTASRAPLLPAPFICAPNARASRSQSTANSRRSSRVSASASRRVPSIATTYTPPRAAGGAAPRPS